MSLWRDSRRLRWPEGIEKWPFFLGLACILVAVLGSLLLIGGGGHGGGDAAPSAPGPSSPPTPSASASGNPADSGKGSHSAGGLTVKS